MVYLAVEQYRLSRCPAIIARRADLFLFFFLQKDQTSGSQIPKPQ